MASLKVKTADWKDHTLEQRFMNCGFMLNLHELLTDSEWSKVKRRIQKLKVKEAKENAKSSE